VRNDRWGRTYESYSEDPKLVARLAGALITGLQGEPGTDSFLNEHHILATAKHFLADGGTEGGDDQGDARIGESELIRVHAPGYIAALNAGGLAVMASYSSWNGQKMHGNGYLLTDVLRGELDFQGLVVGDWNGHGQVPGCTNDRCAQAINAGVDLVMVPNDWEGMVRNTLADVEAGTISMERLDEAVTRVLLVKRALGLFDGRTPLDWVFAGRDEIIGAPEHRAVARQAVRESLVLLKNAGGVLPIRGDAHVLVTGDGADDLAKQTGGWTVTWQGTGTDRDDYPGATSIHQGLLDALTSQGGSAEIIRDGSYQRRPDVAVVVFGEDPYAEGRGDLDDLAFSPSPERQPLESLQALRAEGIPVVSVFLSGRPLWVDPYLEASDAFVAAWLPGSEGGGVADVLVGDAQGRPRHDFRGRLSFSWPAAPSQDVLNHDMADYAPRFPFGHGLTYGESPPTG
jgi:beta-glucosidase